MNDQKAVWTLDKYPSRFYLGKYEKGKCGKRKFVLSGKMKNGKIHTVSFDSPEQAKLKSWKRL